MSLFELVVRTSVKDVHYGGNLVAGAYLMELFGDAITGLAAVYDLDEGLLASWEKVAFLKPLFPGDFVRVIAKIDKRTRLRRFVSVNAYRFIRSTNIASSNVEPVIPEECIATAKGIFVVPYKKKRIESKKDLRNDSISSCARNAR